MIADRRKEGPDSVKSAKDRAQAAFLIDILAEDRPDDLVEAFEDALSRGARWRERLLRTLKRLPQTKQRLADAGIQPKHLTGLD